MNIHPTAIISPEAEISETAEVGAYAVVEGAVRIGEKCRVYPHAQIVGEVVIGARSSVGRGAVIGEYPQDLSFDPSVRSGVEIGEDTVIREHVSIHRGSGEGGVTRVGDRGFLMVGSHLGHDAQVGDDCVLANAVLIGGHCEMGNRIFIGGGTVVHQFVRIGDHAMLQGLSGFSLDIPPYCLGGRINTLFGLNMVGLRRAGVSRETRKGLKEAYGAMVGSGNREEALAKVGKVEGEVGHFYEFFRAPSKKGVCGREGR